MDSLGGMTEYQYDALDRMETVLQDSVTLPSLRSSDLGLLPLTDSRVGSGRSGGANSLKRKLRRRGGAGEVDQVIDYLLPVRPLRPIAQGTSVNEKRVDLVYDDAGALRELHRINLAVPQGVADTFYDYDCGGCPSRLTEIHHRKASDGSTIHDIDLARDALGNILNTTDAEGPHAYTYDGLRRLLTADHPEGGDQPDEFYTYDDVGNRLSSHLSGSYVYSYMLPECGGLGECGNQLRQDDQFDYGYDDNGNLILKTDRTTGD